MNIQSGRRRGGIEQLIRRDATPPAPGQAYFGYPQPSPFPIPAQQLPAGTLDRPYRAHQSPARRRRHLAGHAFAVLLGLLIGIALMWWFRW